MSLREPRAMGAALPRVEAWDKVTGQAPYAYEYPLADPLYVSAVRSTIARGHVTSVDISAAEAIEGVRAVLTPTNAPTLADTDDAEFAVLQSGDVAFRGQIVAAVIADTPEIAREAAAVVDVSYDQRPHEVALDGERARRYRPAKVNPAYEPDAEHGDTEAALTAAPVLVDRTYRTPMEHNNPMEPHTTVALWEEAPGRLTLYDSTQSVHDVRATIATVLGLDRERVRVVAPHVGGGFGSKGSAHAHNVLAAMAARTMPEHPVKLALTRRQMFSLVGYRTPTVQRVRLGADATGRLTAIAHDVVEQTATIKEFAEQTAVYTRVMYAAPNRSTSHRLAALDVPIPFWMRAPGAAPGMFATEVAMDELAYACGVDPVELRARNDPDVDPESGKPWSGRHLVACLREGARRFGWHDRDPLPGPHRNGSWYVGTGVAASFYPRYAIPGSVAAVRLGSDERYEVRIGAADIGTGARTALTQIAADALERPVSDVRVEIGDTELPQASVAGGSSGTTSWGSAIVGAVEAFRDEHGAAPVTGAESRSEAPRNPDTRHYAVYSFGAQFAEVHVHADTGDIRVPRMLGVFSVGRVINPRTARSQFLGGMTMGLSMALHEHSTIDPRFGHVVNGDLAEYHIATNADIGDMEATWLDEVDPRSNPMGSRGIGEIGIVGSAATIANAAYHATGLRVRELPLTPDRFLT